MAILESFVKWPTKKKIVVLGVFYAVVCVLFYFLAYAPDQKRLKEREGKNAELERRLAELRGIAANMKQWQADVVNLREKIRIVSMQLPTSREIPTLLTKVSQVGKESGLEFLLFKPGGEVSKEYVAEIPVEIRVRGTYHNVALFFDRVGKLDRIVNISEVAMDTPREAFGRWEINTACTATTFKAIERDAAELAKDKKDRKPGPPSPGGPPTKP